MTTLTSSSSQGGTPLGAAARPFQPPTSIVACSSTGPAPLQQVLLVLPPRCSRIHQAIRPARPARPASAVPPHPGLPAAAAGPVPATAAACRHPLGGICYLGPAAGAARGGRRAGRAGAGGEPAVSLPPPLLLLVLVLIVVVVAWVGAAARPGLAVLWLLFWPVGRAAGQRTSWHGIPSIRATHVDKPPLPSTLLALPLLPWAAPASCWRRATAP